MLQSLIDMYGFGPSQVANFQYGVRLYATYTVNGFCIRIITETKKQENEYTTILRCFFWYCLIFSYIVLIASRIL